MSEERAPEQAGIRPAGKRQVVGSATATEAAQAQLNDEEKLGGGVSKFLPEVNAEMRKVIWPTARQMVTSVVVVVIFLVAMTALVSVVDYLAGMGVSHLFG
ncbi:MAG: preprotein translocase subunit SecE [Corynebacterium sp.]|nr:preprotein translocase subunit SecE [Corynebacterium sp.]